MHQRIIRRYQRIYDGLLMRTSPVGAMNQARHAGRMSHDLYAVALLHGKLTGRLLFDSLPQRVCNRVMNRWFDPYNKDLSESEMFNWLWDHVMFDPDGDIIAVLDHGIVLTNDPNWFNDTEWFGRVKRLEWTRRMKEQHDSRR